MVQTIFLKIFLVSDLDIKCVQDGHIYDNGLLTLLNKYDIIKMAEKSVYVS